MTGHSIAAMRAETAALASDLDALVDLLVAKVGDLDLPAAPDQVVIVGNGDSRIAGDAVASAVAELSGGYCQVIPAQRFLTFGTPPGAPVGPRTVVVGVSASGRNPTVVAALETARRAGAHTIGLTGIATSPVAGAAAHSLVAELAGLQASPGIRTYQASLLGLLLLGWRLGDGGTVVDVPTELRQLAPAVDRTAAWAAQPCRVLAERLRDPTPVQFLGAGSAEATARYAAVKVIEAAAVPALGQDHEEWWHVERFATRSTAPLVVLAPHGHAYTPAVNFAARARARGHWVAVVAEPTATPIDADLLIPLAGTPRGWWSPLVQHVFAGILAADLAELIGRTPFTESD